MWAQPKVEKEKPTLPSFGREKIERKWKEIKNELRWSLFSLFLSLNRGDQKEKTSDRLRERKDRKRSSFI